MIALDVDTSAHTVGQTIGLLEDFLQHEMGIATLLNLSEVDVDGLYLQGLFLAQDAEHLQLFTLTDDSDITVFQIDDLVSIFDDRTGITTKEEFVLTDTHHQGTLLTGSNNLGGVALVDDGNGISANNLIESSLNGLQQRELLLDHNIFDQLNKYLGIGIALERHTLFNELGLDVGIVLDDTVMDDGQVVALGIVRVSITAGGLAMRSPTGMGNAYVTRHILIAAIFCQIIDLSLCLIDV